MRTKEVQSVLVIILALATLTILFISLYQERIIDECHKDYVDNIQGLNHKLSNKREKSNYCNYWRSQDFSKDFQPEIRN